MSYQSLLEQQAAIGQSSNEDTARGWGTVGEMASLFNQVQAYKTQKFKDKLDVVNAVSKELGDLTGEFVDQKKASLLKDIKESVVKDMKVGGLSFGKTVDVKKLNQFNSEIAKLAKLTKNSQMIDKIYKRAVDVIDKDKFIPDSAKQTVIRNVTRSLVDPDILENFDTNEVLQNIDGIVKGGSDINRVVIDLMGEVGTRKVNLPDGKGGYTASEVPAIFDIDDKKGGLVFNQEGAYRFMRAYNKAKELGYSGDFNTAVDQFVQSQDSALKISERYRDPLDEALKRERLKKSRGQNKVGGQSIDVLANFIKNPNIFDGAGTKKQLKDILRSEGIDFTRNGNEVTFKSSQFKKVGDIEFDPKGQTYNLSDSKDVETMRAFLQKVISDENIKDLDNIKLIQDSYSHLEKVLGSDTLMQRAQDSFIDDRIDEGIEGTGKFVGEPREEKTGGSFWDN